MGPAVCCLGRPSWPLMSVTEVKQCPPALGKAPHKQPAAPLHQQALLYVPSAQMDTVLPPRSARKFSQQHGWLGSSSSCSQHCHLMLWGFPHADKQACHVKQQMLTAVLHASPATDGLQPLRWPARHGAGPTAVLHAVRDAEGSSVMAGLHTSWLSCGLPAQHAGSLATPCNV